MTWQGEGEEGGPIFIDNDERVAMPLDDEEEGYRVSGRTGEGRRGEEEEEEGGGGYRVSGRTGEGRVARRRRAAETAIGRERWGHGRQRAFRDGMPES